MTATHAPRILVVAENTRTVDRIRDSLVDRVSVDCLQGPPAVPAADAQLDGCDLAVVDLDMPGDQGVESVEHLRHSRPDLPILALTQATSTETAARALRAGASDCLALADDDRSTLTIAIDRTLAAWETQRHDRRLRQELEQSLQGLSARNRQLEEVIDHLEKQALTDPLTGLANRRQIRDTLERSFSESARYGTDLAVLMIDIDGFKQLNDTYGHQTGDRLLEATAKVLTTQCRRCDIACRYGGDEFLVLLPHAPPDVAQQVARRIKDHFRTAARDLVPDLPDLHLSIGVACVSLSHPASAQQLVALSDAALYRAKAEGKARIYIHRPPSAEVTCEAGTFQACDGLESRLVTARR